MTAVIISVHLKKKNLSKLVNFCVAILILKMEEKQHFLWIMLYYMQLKCKKRFVQYMEKVLWLIERVRSGLQSFVLEISRWTVLQGRPVEVDSDQMETVIENGQHYTTREIADILKISKSSVENHLHQLGYVNCSDVWIPRKLSEKKPS